MVSGMDFTRLTLFQDVMLALLRTKASKAVS